MARKTKCGPGHVSPAKNCKLCVKRYNATRYAKVKATPVLMERLAAKRRKDNAVRFRTVYGRVYYYKQNAKLSGKVFNLPFALCEDLMTGKCFYCLADPLPFNGIDRVDNNLGYIVDNVVGCCSRCNLAKKDMDRSEFEQWATRVAAVAKEWEGKADGHSSTDHPKGAAAS